MASSDGQSITGFIRDQHADIKLLFSAVERNNGEQRRDAFESLVRLLAIHETAEEEVVYPVVRSAGQLGAEIAEARAAEESEVKAQLSRLERVGTDSDEFPPRFCVLRAAMLQHAASEEQTMLPFLEQTQEQDTLERMGGAADVTESLLRGTATRTDPTACGATWWRPSTGHVMRSAASLAG
jgi:hemerythrin superfamily protein